MSDSAELAGLLSLAESRIPPDIQELLLRGNPERGIAPNALRNAIQAAAALSAGEGGAGYKHKKRGTYYSHVGTAELQSTLAIHEGAKLEIYKAHTDGKLWARPTKEFHDGRFEQITPAPQAPSEEGGVDENDSDFVACEMCDNTRVPHAEAVYSEDNYFCPKCLAEWKEEFEKCEHQWKPHVDVYGDECHICERCNGIEHDDALPNPQPRKDGEAKHRMEDTISFGPGFCSRCGSADPDELSKPCPATSDGKVYAAASTLDVPAGASEEGWAELRECAAEILANRETGLLQNGGYLRARAEKLTHVPEHIRLRVAEDDVCIEALRAVSTTADLLKAAKAAVSVAEEARQEWDRAPDGMKAGKLLIALAGGCPGYRADIDAIHAAIRSAEGSGDA